jgi:hypothetical protein
MHPPGKGSRRRLRAALNKSPITLSVGKVLVMKQQALAMPADQTFEQYRKPTPRDGFLKTMETIVHGVTLGAVIEPHCPKAGNGRPPIGLERMLRLYVIQHGFNWRSCKGTLGAKPSLTPPRG